MGEQNRRAVDLEPGATPPRKARRTARPDPPPTASPETDESQTLRQAPADASPGEGAQGDGIG